MLILIYIKINDLREKTLCVGRILITESKYYMAPLHSTQTLQP